MSSPITLNRKTAETEITGSLDLRGSGEARVDTGLGFLDHMLSALAKHSRFDIELNIIGDLHVDDHHVVEDAAIVLGRGLDEALGDRAGITRFGHAYAPLDEALTRVVVDLSGRGWAEVDLPFTREMVGDVATENLIHFLTSLAAEARMTLHVDSLRGFNNHHIAESAFKALALALSQAVAPRDGGVPSTKGSLT